MLAPMIIQSFRKTPYNVHREKPQRRSTTRYRDTSSIDRVVMLLLSCGIKLEVIRTAATIPSAATRMSKASDTDLVSIRGIEMLVWV